MTSDSLSTRDDILSRVGDIFYAKGTYLVGMAELVKHLRTTRATFYRYFESKEALIVVYLEQRDVGVRESLAKIAAGRLGEDPTLAVFSNLEERTQAENFRGCAFLLAAIENPHSKEILRAARNHKIFLKDFFRYLVGGEDTLAEQLLLLYEGALAGSVLRREAAAATTAKSIAAKLLSEWRSLKLS
ncbi:MAG: TetR/AcrR family transcriptional regulator [Phyllobacterium sp.]